MTPSITASVGNKGINRSSDVETVQGLLNRVPSERGGPMPLLAVDGLCYGKTQAAIGRFQKVGCSFQWPDNLIQPNRRTWTELVKFAPGDAPISGITITCFPRTSTASSSGRVFLASTSSVGPEASITPESLLAAANQALPKATAWVLQMLARLLAVKQSVARFKVYSPAELAHAAPFKTHFKIDLASQTDTVVRSRLDRVQKIVGRIQLALAALPHRMVGDPSTPAKALAPLGGFDITGSKVTIGADFVGPTSNSNLRAAVLVHECAHFVDKDCSHVASELPKPSGSPITDVFALQVNPAGLNYSQMTFELAIRNAYSFAQCAAHCGLGFDKRPL